MNSPHGFQYEVVQEQEFEEHSELGRLYGVLLDEKRLIAAIALLFLIAGIFYAVFATPIYKADALLQVEQKPTGMSGLADLTGAFELESEAITEIEVLMSRMVVGRVVDELNLDIDVKRKYLPLVGEGLSRMLGAGMRENMSALFSGYAWDQEQIKVSKLEMPGHLLEEELTLEVGEGGSYTLSLGGKPMLSGVEGQIAEENGIRILVSDLYDRPGLQFTVTKHSKIYSIRRLQEELAVSEKGRRSGVLAVSLQGTDREKTKKILDSLARQYLLQNVQRMSAEAEKSLEFLQKQLPDVKQKLMTAEAVLNSYRLKNESVDLSLETQSILEQVVALDGQLNELTLEETRLQKLFTPQHPTYLSLLEKRNALTEKKEKLQNKIKALPETQQDILRLARDVEVNQTLYVQMLNKVQELNIVKAGTVGNVRILDTAELMEKPVSPKRFSAVTIALLLGLIVGFAIAIIRVALRRGVDSPDQLEALGLPVYATIPLSEVQQKITQYLMRRRKQENNGTSGVLARVAPDDVAVEAIRSLRTSMHFAMLETTKHILMITGPGPDLGKSFVSTNLAAVYAQSGKKVLVIDADMRKGHIHRSLKLRQENGLSEVLSDQIQQVEAIQKTEVDGMDFISCGKVPPNPAELLMHQNMQDLLDWASAEYDMVILDTPPVLAVTDATIVGRYASVTMFVARFEITQRKELDMALRRCEQGGVNVKGCILNGIITRSSSRYGYGYQYQDYRYGKEDPKKGFKKYLPN